MIAKRREGLILPGVRGEGWGCKRAMKKVVFLEAGKAVSLAQFFVFVSGADLII